MLIALLVGWTFLGFTTQVVCVVLGGVGFGPPYSAQKSRRAWFSSSSRTAGGYPCWVG